MLSYCRSDAKRDLYFHSYSWIGATRARSFRLNLNLTEGYSTLYLCRDDRTYLVAKSRSMCVKGIRRVSIYYASAFLAALVIHFAVGWEHRILMPRSFLVIILFGLGALPWAFLNISNLLCPHKRPQNVSELMTHMFFLSLISVAGLRLL